MVKSTLRQFTLFKPNFAKPFRFPSRLPSRSLFSHRLENIEHKLSSLFNPARAKFSSSIVVDALKPNPGYTKPIVGYWYFFTASLVFSIVILGGVTRLTESGLSITEWNLIKGMKPPRSQSEWEEEFEKYKQFPEYKLLNHNITLEEFKRIFYYEWAHRMLGRFIGLAFILPGAYFAQRGYMSSKIKYRSLLVAALIGTQGVFGWLMVKSGLSEEILEKKDVPRVNHFWLSTHLGSAFIIYCIMLSTGLEILARNSGSNSLDILKDAKLVRFRKYASFLACLVFVTAISGAWVAGLDAGLIYNEFPYMGEGFVPSDMWAFSTQTKSNPNPMPLWENLVRNPSAVQFNHRLMAYTTFTSVSLLWALSRKRPLPSTARLAINALMAVACAQVTLGIATLLYFVPVPLAAAHQGGSLTLLTVAVWLVHTLKYIPK